MWFDITGSPDKMFELRRKSKWIISRLFDKSGNPRSYDYVEIKRGYGHDAPKKIFIFDSISTIAFPYRYLFLNGCHFDVAPGDFLIKFH